MREKNLIRNFPFQFIPAWFNGAMRVIASLWMPRIIHLPNHQDKFGAI